jgi:hypothetical protein
LNLLSYEEITVEVNEFNLLLSLLSGRNKKTAYPSVAEKAVFGSCYGRLDLQSIMGHVVSSNLFLIAAACQTSNILPITYRLVKA